LRPAPAARASRLAAAEIAWGEALQTKSFGSADLWHSANLPAQRNGISAVRDLLIQSVHSLRKDPPQLVISGSGVLDKIDSDEQVYSLVEHLS